MNSWGWRWTLLHCKKWDFLTVSLWKNITTPSFGKENQSRKQEVWCRICCQKSPATDDNSSEKRNQKDAHTLLIKLINRQGSTNILCIYASTMSASSETKDKFCDDLDTAVKNMPSNEFFLLLGDSNARVGSDKDIWATCLSHHGIGKMNENRQWLMEFCCIHSFCMTSSFFQTKPYQKVSGKHPRSGLWHQLDLITPDISF